MKSGYESRTYIAFDERNSQNRDGFEGSRIFKGSTSTKSLAVYLLIYSTSVKYQVLKTFTAWIVEEKRVLISQTGKHLDHQL